MQMTDWERVKHLAVKKLAGLMNETEEAELRGLMEADEQCRLLVERLLSTSFRAQAAAGHHREDCRRSWHRLHWAMWRRRVVGRRIGWWPCVAAAAVAGVVFGWVGLKQSPVIGGLSMEVPVEAVVYAEGLDAPQTIQGVYDFPAIREWLFRQMGHKLEARTTSQYTRICVPEGRRYKVRLSDGTWVYLGGGAYLSVPADFSDTNRHVNLVGDAHLEVGDGHPSPLYIYTGSGDVRIADGSLDFYGGVDGRDIEVCMSRGCAEVVSPRDCQRLSSHHRAIIDSEGYVVLHPNNRRLQERVATGFWQNRQLDEQALAYSEWK